MNELPCASDPEAMFPTSAHNANLNMMERQVARDICGMCPTAVKAACLEFVIAAEMKEAHSFGVAGGLTSQERRRIINTANAKGPRGPKAECGTPGGFSSHRRAGTPACDPCRRAETRRAHEYNVTRRAALAGGAA